MRYEVVEAIGLLEEVSPSVVERLELEGFEEEELVGEEDPEVELLKT